jgi:hypothetical protein
VADLAERHQLVEVVLPVPEAALADVVDLETTAGLGLGLLLLLRFAAAGAAVAVALSSPDSSASWTCWPTAGPSANASWPS